MLAVGDETALHLLEYADRGGLERHIERLRVRAKAGIVPGRTGPIAQIEAELAACFAGGSMRSRRRSPATERRPHLIADIGLLRENADREMA
jgi:hypothetical protein